MNFVDRQSSTGLGRKARVRAAALLAAGGWALLAAGPLPEGRPLRVAKASPGERPAGAGLAELRRRIADGYPRLGALYKRLHSHPELSSQEAHTSARLAKELEGTGFHVTRHVGGFGLVAVLRNGPGPTVLVRTEMDALPVVEKTGLPYASTVRTRDRRGNEVGVMHACGHDVHMACWVGTARVLAGLRDRWRGTLVFIAQPAEETGTGADRMLEGGLFRRFPRPDYCLALHCDAQLPVGHVAFTRGLAMANVDTVDITVRGKGGHGASPHLTVDPVVLSARLILDLQTLVSRENNPTDPLVVTVGSIHGGTKHNVIPDEVRLQLTVRSTRDSSRKRALEGIARMARAAAAGAGAPEPVLNIHPSAFTPALLNDGGLAERTAAVFRATLGEGHVHECPPRMLGEDFAVYGRQGVPVFLYFLGTQPPELVAESEREGGHPLPSLHSDQFHPLPEPTIKTGVLTMSRAVLNLLGKDRRSEVSSRKRAGLTP
jgi:amidohydrolase